MIEQIIKITEKILLGLIGIATVFATSQEIYFLILQQKVQLADLLLLFIYTEVLGMVAVFYKSRRIPILLPLFIAITALSRMIILQGKGSDPQNLIYEAGAVLLLAVACFVVSQKSVSIERNLKGLDDFDLKGKKK
jgi:protein PsiE